MRHHVRQQAAVVADLDHDRAGGAGVGYAAHTRVRGPARRPAAGHGRLRRQHGHLARVGLELGRAVRPGLRDLVGPGVVQLQVELAVAAGVEDAQPVGLALHAHVGVRGSVDQHRVVERVGHHREAGCAGDLLGLRRPAAVERVGLRPVHRPLVAGPVPGQVVPASPRIEDRLVADAARVADPVLVGHVHVGVPERAQAAPPGQVPGRVGRAQPVRRGDERLVLDDERQLVGRHRAGGDELVLHLVADDVRRRLARVHVEPRQPVGVVVQVEQAGALAVGEVQGGRARARVVGRAGCPLRHRPALRVEPHVRHVDQRGAGAVRARLAGRRDPLVLRAAADPRREPAVQVQGGSRGGVDLVPALRPGPCPCRGGVHRQEQVAGLSGRELVDELDAHRPAAPRADQRPEVADGRRRDRVAPAGVRAPVELHVAAQSCEREVAVELLRVVADGQFVVVRARIGDGVRHCHRDVLAELVGGGRAHARQPVDELAEQRAVGPVGDAVVVGRRVGVQARREPAAARRRPSARRAKPRRSAPRRWACRP